MFVSYCFYLCTALSIVIKRKLPFINKKFAGIGQKTRRLLRNSPTSIMLTTVLKFGFNVRFDNYKYKSEIVPKKLILHVFERRNISRTTQRNCHSRGCYGLLVRDRNTYTCIDDVALDNRWLELPISRTIFAGPREFERTRFDCTSMMYLRGELKIY